EGDRVMDAATEEECIFLACKGFGPGDDLRFQRQYGGNGGWQMAHFLEEGGFFFFRQAAFDLCQGQRQQEQCRELGGEGFGGGNADFDASTCDVGQFAFAHHGAGGGIADRQCVLHAL